MISRKHRSVYNIERHVRTVPGVCANPHLCTSRFSSCRHFAPFTSIIFPHSRRSKYPHLPSPHGQSLKLDYLPTSRCQDEAQFQGGNNVSCKTTFANSRLGSQAAEVHSGRGAHGHSAYYGPFISRDYVAENNFSRVLISSYRSLKSSKRSLRRKGSKLLSCG